MKKMIIIFVLVIGLFNSSIVYGNDSYGGLSNNFNA